MSYPAAVLILRNALTPGFRLDLPRQMQAYEPGDSRTDSGTTFPKALGLFVSHTRTRCTRHVCKQMSNKVAGLLSQLRTLNFAVCCSTFEVFVRAVFRLFLKVALRDTRETKRKVIQQFSDSVLRCEKCALKHGGRQFEEFLWLGVVTSCC